MVKQFYSEIRDYLPEGYMLMPAQVRTATIDIINYCNQLLKNPEVKSNENAFLCVEQLQKFLNIWFNEFHKQVNALLDRR